MGIPNLKTVLYANAIFCSVSALVILIFSGLLAQYVIDLPVLVFIVLGIGLMAFALDVFFAACKAIPSRGKALYIFFADLSWVILTPIAMLLLTDKITGLGNFLLLDIAIIVGSLAVFEWVGIGKLN